MKTEELILERLHQLPEHLYYELIDYMDFLLIKHSTEKETYISDEHKKILDERLEKYKNNTSVGDTWENVKERLEKKYVI